MPEPITVNTVFTYEGTSAETTPSIDGYASKVGDLMVAVISKDDDLALPTGPSGWTRMFSQPAGSAVSVSVWTKTAVTGDLSSTTYTWTGDSELYLICLFSLSSTDLTGVTWDDREGNSTDPYSYLATDTVYGDIALYGFTADAGALPHTLDSDLTALVLGAQTTGGGSGDVGHSIGYEYRPAALSSSYLSTCASQEWAAWLILLHFNGQLVEVGQAIENEIVGIPKYGYKYPMLIDSSYGNGTTDMSTLLSYTGTLNGMVFSPDGLTLIVLTYDGENGTSTVVTFREYALSTAFDIHSAGSQLYSFSRTQSKQYNPVKLVFSSDGSTLISCYTLIDAASSGRCSLTFSLPNSYSVQSMSYDGVSLAVANDTHMIDMAFTSDGLSVLYLMISEDGSREIGIEHNVLSTAWDVTTGTQFNSGNNVTVLDENSSIYPWLDGFSSTNFTGIGIDFIGDAKDIFMIHSSIGEYIYLTMDDEDDFTAGWSYSAIFQISGLAGSDTHSMPLFLNNGKHYFQIQRRTDLVEYEKHYDFDTLEDIGLTLYEATGTDILLVQAEEDDSAIAVAQPQIIEASLAEEVDYVFRLYGDWFKELTLVSETDSIIEITPRFSEIQLINTFQASKTVADDTPVLTVTTNANVLEGDLLHIVLSHSTPEEGYGPTEEDFAYYNHKETFDSDSNTTLGNIQRLYMVEASADITPSGQIGKTTKPKKRDAITILDIPSLSQSAWDVLTGFDFNDDGTEVSFLTFNNNPADNNQEVYLSQYTVSTAYDLSSTLTQQDISVFGYYTYGGADQPRGLIWSPTGDYFTIDYGTYIYYVSCSTDYDVTTAATYPGLPYAFLDAGSGYSGYDGGVNNGVWSADGTSYFLQGIRYSDGHQGLFLFEGLTAFDPSSSATSVTLLDYVKLDNNGVLYVLDADGNLLVISSRSAVETNDGTYEEVELRSFDTFARAGRNKASFYPDSNYVVQLVPTAGSEIYFLRLVTGYEHEIYSVDRSTVSDVGGRSYTFTFPDNAADAVASISVIRYAERDFLHSSAVHEGTAIYMDVDHDDSPRDGDLTMTSASSTSRVSGMTPGIDIDAILSSVTSGNAMLSVGKTFEADHPAMSNTNANYRYNFTSGDFTYSEGGIHATTYYRKWDKFIDMPVVSETDSSFVAVPETGIPWILQASSTESSFTVLSNKVKSILQGSDTETSTVIELIKAKILTLTTETDSGFTLKSIKTVDVAESLETDSAQDMSIHRTYGITAAVESDISFSITIHFNKYIPVDQSSETDSGFVVKWVREIGILQSLEDDVAITVQSNVGAPIAQSVEIDSPFNMDKIKHKSIEQILSDESSFPLTSSKLASIDLPSENNSAFPVTSGKKLSILITQEQDSSTIIDTLKQLSISTAYETNVTFVLDGLKFLLLGSSTDTSTSFSIDRDKIEDLLLAQETDTSNVVKGQKQIELSITSEIDSANDVTLFSTIEIPVLLATEIDSSYSVDSTKSKSITYVVEQDNATIISTAKVKPVLTSIEIDNTTRILTPQFISIEQGVDNENAFELNVIKDVSLGLATANDSAHIMQFTKAVHLNMAGEFDVALATQSLKETLISAGIESDSSFDITEIHALTLSQVIETDSGNLLGSNKTIYVWQGLENNSATIIPFFLGTFSNDKSLFTVYINQGLAKNLFIREAIKTEGKIRQSIEEEVNVITEKKIDGKIRRILTDSIDL